MNTSYTANLKSFTEAVHYALQSQNTVQLCMTTAWILFSDKSSKPNKNPNIYMMAIALAVARNIQRAQGGERMIRFSEGPLLTDSNREELREWVRKQIDLNSKVHNGYVDTPLQTIVQILSSQLRAEDVQFKTEMSRARQAGSCIYTPEELERELDKVGLTPAWENKLSRDGATLADLASSVINSRLQRKLHPWRSRADRLIVKMRDIKEKCFAST